MLQSLTPEQNSNDLIQESERYVQSALDSLTAHVAIIDQTGTIIRVNAAWRSYAQVNGFKDTSYGIGTNYLTVCDNAARRGSHEAQIVAVGIRDVMKRRKKEFHLEYPCHTPQQKQWYVLRVTHFEWYGHDRFIIAHQNVTELKQVQVDLDENRKRIQVILDTVVNGIITLDEANSIETANPAAGQIFGCDMQEIIGHNFDDFLLEPCPAACMQTNINYELVGRRKDGTTFPMSFAMNTVQLDNRQIYTVVIQDITERKRMEADLLETEKLKVALEKERQLREFKARFLSMMSHELRTPLTSIRLSHDMLTTYADQTSAEERPQILANIRSQVEYLTDLVKDVLTLSKAEIQQLEFAPETGDLLTYCRGIVEEFQLNYYKTHKITFNTNCALVEAKIDKKLLRQAMNNLLSNAIKYSPKGGSVRFALLCENPNEVVIRVSDEGIGIPEADLANLFEPFYRAGNVENLPGTGLGLAITRQAIEIHGGQISVESHVGQGTTFMVCLPVLAVEIWHDDDDDWA